MHRTPSRAGQPFRAAFAALGITLLLACGGSDGPTGVQPNPDPDPNPPGGEQPPLTPRTMAMGADSARANEFITLRPTGLQGTLPDTITGTIGTADFRAVRMDDSTLVGLVPAGVTGTQTVSFEIGDRSYESNIVLLNPVSVADPTAAVTSVYAFVNARLDSIAGAIDAGDVHPSDTASTRNFITSARAAIDDAEQEFLAMSADEQEAASPYILAQLAALGIEVEPSSPSAALTGGPGFYGYPSYATETDGRCTADSNVSNCNKTSWVQSQVKLGATMLAKCSGTVIASAGVGGLIGGLLGGGLGSFLAGAGAAPGLVAGIKQGAALGAVAGLVICKLEVVDKLSALYDKSVNGVMKSVNKDLSNSMYPDGLQPSLSIEAAGTGDTYTSGVPAQVDVMVEFRSISAADADGPPVLASLVQQFNAVASAWNTLRAKATFLDLPALTLPASPRLVVTRTVPGEYLSITAVTPAPIQATDTSGEPWMVTFTNQQQGDDHDFSYNVRFSFGGLPDQEQELGGTLRPSKYTVASLQLTPAIDTVLVGTSVSFEWAAADSSGDILTDSLLLGRKPTWTSGSPTVATVGASSGSVTGKQAGNAMIEAALEKGEASVSVEVLQSIYGTYTLILENGRDVPGVTYEDSLYVIYTSGGSVTLNEDGTFGFSRSATGSNTQNSDTFNEGGSGGGTFTVNGSALTFITVEQEGPVRIGSGSVNGNVLTVTVQNGEDSGSGVLVRNP